MNDDAKMWQEAHARAVAEIARLRSVCREAVSRLDDDVYPLLERGGTARCLLAKITCILADAGKEPSDSNPIAAAAVREAGK